MARFYMFAGTDEAVGLSMGDSPVRVLESGIYGMCLCSRPWKKGVGKKSFYPA